MASAGFPRTRGDRPCPKWLGGRKPWVPPHKWAVGTSFEWEFEFPMATNPFYELKPEPKGKTKKPAKPKAKSTRAPETPKPATAKTAKPKAAKKPKRVRLTAEERKNEVAHAPPRTASSSKSRASAEIVGNLRYPGKPVAQNASTGTANTGRIGSPNVREPDHVRKTRRPPRQVSGVDSCNSSSAPMIDRAEGNPGRASRFAPNVHLNMAFRPEVSRPRSQRWACRWATTIRQNRNAESQRQPP